MPLMHTREHGAEGARTVKLWHRGMYSTALSAWGKALVSPLRDAGSKSTKHSGYAVAMRHRVISHEAQGH